MVIYAVGPIGGSKATLGIPRANCFHFHTGFGRNWQTIKLMPPPLWLAPPPLGNPRSVTGLADLGGARDAPLDREFLIFTGLGKGSMGHPTLGRLFSFLCSFCENWPEILG